MDRQQALVVRMYEDFNARQIDGVLAALASDVAWANGMDGGHVHGHAALRQYWTQQWAQISPHVQPVRFAQAADGALVVTVMQTVRDLAGQPLQDQAHGLHDRLVRHVFTFAGDQVVRFDIEDAA
ncbi:nuclear transport factor 2 family protein [Massilia sp. DWR3-1-1]|uniref:nuclear transport factor 2 family protein n=1 Tax=Massilia sp. DWR3-1-1 TaxID=2804559 RepID=UPI003CEF67C5